MATLAVQQPETIVASREHCMYCFDVLSAELQGKQQPAPHFTNTTCALFVTWNTSEGQHADSSGKQHRLRGCIGTLEPRSLHAAIKDYALTSALRDSRFSPIAYRELPYLSCKVSLLSAFETAKDWQDWRVGKHGIIISFTDPEKRVKRSATFLPDVAPEQGWDVKQCVDALIRKAGYHGHVDDALRQALHVQRYQSSISGLTYEDWMALAADCN